MPKLPRNKAFYIGFFCGLFLFAGLNFYDLAKGTNCFDCYEVVGVPFPFHESGTMAHLSNTLWFGLAFDILIAVSSSFGIGWLLSCYRNSVAVRKPFRKGFFVGLTFFVAVHLLNYLTILVDDPLNYSFGFPFAVYRGSFFSEYNQFYLIGFIRNVFATIIFSLITGLVFKFGCSETSASKLNLK